MKKHLLKIILLILLAALVGSFFAFDLQQYATLDTLKQHRQTLEDYYAQNTGLTILIYFGVYVATTALSLPGATVLTLAGGMLFGLVNGLIIVSFASTAGATLAFLASRYLIGSSVQRKFGDKLKTINEGVRKDGVFYLISLRLMPIFPFFLINLLMGLTAIRLSVFYIVSQIGMLPGTLVYINAGTEIAKITSLKGILSPTLIFSFVLLGIFPLIAKAFVNFLKARRTYSTEAN